MAIAITEDFVTKGGLIVQGTGTVTTSTIVSSFQTGTLQVAGGAAIAKNLIVGTSATIYGKLTVSSDNLISGNFIVAGNSRLGITTASGIVSITDITTATPGGNGAIKISGGAFIGDNIVVASVAASTGSVVNNSLYVAGGVGIAKSLIVTGTALFQSDVIFNGATTNVYSTNTVYTDNLIELHVPSTPTWVLDDGKDIGLRFHYYSEGSNQNGALVLANDTKYLEWYDTGAESTTGTFTATTYGTFKTGNIVLTGDTNATNSQSGALQVAGGLAVGQDIYAGGIITAIAFVGTVTGTVTGIASTATNIAGGTAGAIAYQSQPGVTTFTPIGIPGYVLLSDGDAPVWGPITSASLDFANTATNINFGADMEIPFQTGRGKTEFDGTLKYSYGTNTLLTVNAIFTGTSNAISTISGAVRVVGGVGIGRDLWVGGNEVLLGNLDLRGGNLITNQTSFNLLNNTALTVNFAGSATSITIGDFTGYTDVRNQTRIQNTSSAVSTVTGALQVAGGVGIQGDVYIGGTTYVRNNIIPTHSGLSLGTIANPFSDIYLGPNSLYVDNVVLSSSGTTFLVTSTIGLVLLNVNSGIFTTSTNAISTNSGGLVVAGGVGIGRDIYVGGDIITNKSTFNLANTNATNVNIAGSGTAITIGATSGYVSIRNTETVSSAVTGALRVAGGVGVSGSMFVSDTVTATNLVIKGAYASSYLGTYGSLFIDATSGNQYIQGSTNSLANGIGMWTSGLTNSYVYSSGGIEFMTGKTLRLNNSPTGGVTRMVISAAGNVSMSAGTTSTGITTGTLVVTGGVGISGDLYIGSQAYVNNAIVLTTATIGAFGVSSIIAGTDTVVTSSTGIVSIWNTSTLQSITNRGASTTNVISITNNSIATTTATGALRVTGGVGIGGRLYVGDRTIITSTTTSVSTTTGALTVSGGAGIGQNLYVGGYVYGSLIGTASTTTNIDSGGPGQIPYQTAKGVTGFVATGTSGQVLISAGTSSPVFANTSTLVIGYTTNVSGGAAGSLLYQTSADTTNFITTGSLQVGYAATATNLQAGNVGSIPYQIAVGLTDMLPIGVSGYVLTSDGTSPGWAGIGSLSAGTATNISVTNDIVASSVNYIGFVNTSSGNSNLRVSGPSGLTYQPSTGNFGVGITTATAKIEIVGGAKISGITTITNNTLASSTITGALQIVGGVGVGGNIFVGGSGIVTNQTTFDLINTNAVSVNIAGASTTINIGSGSGNTNINNNLVVAGDLTVQGLTTIVNSTVTNVTDPIITLGGLANNAPYTLDTNQDKGIAFKWHNGVTAKIGFFGYKDSTGVFTIIPDATISGSEVVTGTKGIIDANLNGGTANSIVYQSGPNATTFLSPGTAGHVLTTNGPLSPPSWVKASDNNTATNVSGGTIGQIPFQTGTSLTSFFGPGAAGNVLVSAGATSTGPVFQNTLTLAGTLTSISTTTGALQVRGGVGVGGSIYTGNRIGWTSSTNVSAVYQYYNAATNSLDTVFG